MSTTDGILPQKPAALDSAEPNLNEAREIKVKLPVSLHIKLHGIKITKHRSISEVVLEALEEYFRRLEKPAGDRRQ